MVKKYIISINLKSDAHFDSHSSIAGIEHSKIYRDREGLPYLPAKHFIGVLKNQIEKWIKPSATDEEKELIEEIIEGKAESIKVNWSDFFIDEKIYGEVKKFKSLEKDDALFNQNREQKFQISVDSSEVFTKKRSTIKSKDIKNKYLDSKEVIPAGIILLGTLAIDGYEKEEHYRIDELLKKWMGIVDHLGSKKNRGFGKVRVEVDGIVGSSLISPRNINNDARWIFYKMDLKSPLKLSKEGGVHNFESTNTYISADTIKGAFIGKLLQKGYLDENTVIDFIKGCKFYNSYPMIENRCAFPTPDIYRVYQQDIGKFNWNRDTTKYFISEFDSNSSGKKERFCTVFDQLSKKSRMKYEDTVAYKPGEYFYYNDGTINAFDLTKEVHTRRDQKTNEIYQYELVPSEYSYYGVIELSDMQSNLKSKLIDMLNSISEIHIGSQRRLGYGSVRVTEVEGFENQNDLEMKLGIEKSKTNSESNNYYYSYSDLVGDVNDEDIIIGEKELKLGYNAKWKARIPSIEVYTRGAIIKSDKELENLIKEDDSATKYNYLIQSPKFLEAKAIKTIEISPNEIEVERKTMDTSNVELLQKLKYKYLEVYSDKQVEKYMQEIEINFEKSDLDKLSHIAYFNLYDIYIFLKERLFELNWLEKYDKEEKKCSLIKNELNHEIGNRYIVENLTIYELLGEKKFKSNLDNISENKLYRDMSACNEYLKKFIFESALKNGDLNNKYIKLDYYMQNKLLYKILDDLFKEMKREA
jgi:CRISPR/Cas system CMR subunit Cmr4 (Cas7 group RAMP superfamily)